MRILLAFLLGFFGLAFTVGGIDDLNEIPGWWPETRHPLVIDVTQLDPAGAMLSENDWWLLKGGAPRFDLQTAASTHWKQVDGTVTALTEFYYLPFSACPALPTDAIKIVIAFSADTYEQLRQSDDPFAFERPHGLVSVVEYPNPNIGVTPPFLLMSFHATPGQPENPWMALAIGALLLTMTAGLATWMYYRP